jgi:hypothetical protein
MNNSAGFLSMTRARHTCPEVTSGGWRWAKQVQRRRRQQQQHQTAEAIGHAHQLLLALAPSLTRIRDHAVQVGVRSLKAHQRDRFLTHGHSEVADMLVAGTQKTRESRSSHECSTRARRYLHFIIGKQFQRIDVLSQAAAEHDWFLRYDAHALAEGSDVHVADFTPGDDDAPAVKLQQAEQGDKQGALPAARAPTHADFRAMR